MFSTIIILPACVPTVWNPADKCSNNVSWEEEFYRPRVGLDSVVWPFTEPDGGRCCWQWCTLTRQVPRNIRATEWLIKTFAFYQDQQGERRVAGKLWVTGRIRTPAVPLLQHSQSRLPLKLVGFSQYTDTSAINEPQDWWVAITCSCVFIVSGLYSGQVIYAKVASTFSTRLALFGLQPETSQLQQCDKECFHLDRRSNNNFLSTVGGHYVKAFITVTEGLSGMPLASDAMSAGLQAGHDP